MLSLGQGAQPCGLNPQKCHIWGFRNPLGFVDILGILNTNVIFLIFCQKLMKYMSGNYKKVFLLSFRE